MTNNPPGRACPPIIYGLALDTPARVIDALTGMLERYRRRIGSRWRGYDTGLQAVLTCAWLEGGHTYQQLADGNAVPRETCRRYIHEGVKVLARRALPLTEVVRLAVKAGWPYLIVDGVNIPTERVAAKFTAKQHWYSGKHHRHGAPRRGGADRGRTRRGAAVGERGVAGARPSTSPRPAGSVSPKRCSSSWACWPTSGISVCTPR